MADRQMTIPALLPDGWRLHQLVVFGVLLSQALNLGTDIYVKFLAPVVRGLLN